MLALIKSRADQAGAALLPVVSAGCLKTVEVRKASKCSAVARASDRLHPREENVPWEREPIPGELQRDAMVIPFRVQRADWPGQRWL